MSVVSLIFAIVVTYNPLDCYNVNKCIFITMRFIKRRIYLLHLNLNDIASIFSNLICLTSLPLLFIFYTKNDLKVNWS